MASSSLPTILAKASHHSSAISTTWSSARMTAIRSLATTTTTTFCPHALPSSVYKQSTALISFKQQSLPLSMIQCRFKHAGRMGHKLDKLDEMAHRPEREAAQERRQKKKDRKHAKKKNEKVEETAAAVVEEDEDDDLWLDDDDDDDIIDDEEEKLPSLPDVNEVKDKMNSVMEKFQDSLKSIRGAEPTPEMFDDIQVNAYGSTTPLKSVGQVLIVSPTLAQITCFDPSLAKDVQKAVQLALELNPQLEEGGMVKVPLPRVSMEVREQTAKQLQKKAEACKQRLRQVRRKAMDIVKKGKDGKLEGISKDDAFASGKEIETVMENAMNSLKQIVDEKMDSIMAV